MNQRRMSIILAGLLLTSVPTQAAELTITVKNLLPDQGKVLIAIFESSKGFPDDSDQAQRKQEANLTGTEVTVSFSGLSAGKYAVGTVQDLNGNGKIDYGLFGIPKEPYGVSNNRVPLLSAPTYEEAIVTIGSDDQNIIIEVRQP